MEEVVVAVSGGKEGTLSEAAEVSAGAGGAGVVKSTSPPAPSSSEEGRPEAGVVVAVLSALVCVKSAAVCGDAVA